MNIYLESGYINIKGIAALGMPFNIGYGARGTGKTYGILQWILQEHKCFMFMRRTQTQIEMIMSDGMNPFEPLNRDMNYHVQPVRIRRQLYAFYHFAENSEGTLEPVGPPIGYACALSTVKNVRGFDASSIDVIFYDEFIPERHEPKMKGEADAFFNSVETINRNRELSGGKPVQCFLMANSNDLTNAIFMELQIISKVLSMKKNKQQFAILKERGLALFDFYNSPISDRKSQTALYKLVGGESDFSKMALENEFTYNPLSETKRRPLIEYVPIVNIGELTIYQHKSKRNEYYLSTHKSGSPETYGTNELERMRFARKYQFIWLLYIQNKLLFEDETCEILLDKYFSR